MRLLLDEHFDRAIAEQLRGRGVDAAAVTERPEFVGRPDRELLRAATSERRVLVTNNVRDYAPRVEAFGLRGETHFGVLCTDDDTFPRAEAGIGQLVRSLEAFVAAKPDDWLIDGCVFLPTA